MKKRTRNILVIVGFIGLIIAGIGGYGIYSIYSFFSQIGIAGEIPEQLQETKVFKGSDFLTKNEFFKITKESFLKTIGDSAQKTDPKDREKIVNSQVAKGIYNFADLKVFDDKIIAAAEFGGYVFDLNGNLKRQIFFEPTEEKTKIGWYEHKSYKSHLDNLQIVKLEENRFGFLSYGSMQGVVVYDENGNKIWNYGGENIDLGTLFEDEKQRDANYEKSTHVLGAAVGDLDGDGISEYVVANKNEGIRAFDRNGKELWLQPDEFPSDELKINDLDGDGKNELIETGSKIRNGNGEIIRETKGNDSNAVLFSEGENGKKFLQFCSIRKNKLSCEDENDAVLIEGDAPLSSIKKEKPEKVNIPGHPEMSYVDDSEDAAFPKAVRVKFDKDKPAYIAIIASFIGLPRTNFYVYDEKGNLMYHELLPEDAETIAAIPTDNGKQDILIGGKDTIWRFIAK